MKHHALAFAIGVIIGCLVIGFAFGFASEPIRPTQDVKNFTVTLNFVPARDIARTCEHLGVPYEADGCNAFFSPRNHCEIYVVAPRDVGDSRQLEIMGHELLHCRYGRYHK